MHEDLENRICDFSKSTLYWDPGTANVMLSEKNPSQEFEFTIFLGESKFDGMNFEQRKAAIFIEAIHLIVGDNVNATAVHNALLGLLEYRSGCSDEIRREF